MRLVVTLDRPSSGAVTVNGLDPEGVIWVRHLTRFLASEGRTIFLSSHLMSEMAQTADHIIVLGRGRIIADAPVRDIVALAAGNAVVVRTLDAERFGALLAAPDVLVAHDEPHPLRVTGLSAPQIGELAAHNGVVLHELAPQSGSLEDAPLALTKDEVEYDAGGIAR